MGHTDPWALDDTAPAVKPSTADRLVADVVDVDDAVAAVRARAGELADEDLFELSRIIGEEHRRRALAGGDVDAHLEQMLDTAFDRRGTAEDPEIVGSLLLVPGSLVAKSSTSHRCRFASTPDGWVWDHPERLDHHIRRVGDHDSKRTATAFPVTEGFQLDMVECTASMGQHTVKKVVTFEVRDGELVRTATRRTPAAPPPGREG